MGILTCNPDTPDSPVMGRSGILKATASSLSRDPASGGLGWRMIREGDLVLLCSLCIHLVHASPTHIHPIHHTAFLILFLWKKNLTYLLLKIYSVFEQILFVDLSKIGQLQLS